MATADQFAVDVGAVAAFQIFDEVIVAGLQDMSVIPAYRADVEPNVAFRMPAQYRSLAFQKELLAGIQSVQNLQQSHSNRDRSLADMPAYSSTPRRAILRCLSIQRQPPSAPPRDSDVR